MTAPSARSISTLYKKVAFPNTQRVLASGVHHFDQIMSILVTREIISKAAHFAAQVTPTVGTPGKGYRDAAQHNLQKIHHDHFISKVGEEAVKTVFESFGRVVRGPDYRVYRGKAKSWASDLLVNGVGLAVKTQTAKNAARYGLSWTFQAGERRYDPILRQPDAWVCFVEYNEVRQRCVVYPPYQIRALTFGEPKLERLKTSKKVLYAASLPAVNGANKLLGTSHKRKSLG